MIHDILLSLLKPNVNTLSISNFLHSDVSNVFLHPGEHMILSEIVKIANQHKDIQNFILKYSTHWQHEKTTADDLDETLQKGLYLQSFADGISSVLLPYRQAINDLEQRYLKKPNFSLIFVFQKVNEFQPLFIFLLRLINGIKVQKLHGCGLLQYLQQHSLHGNSQLMEAIRIIQKSVYVVFLKQLSQWIIYGRFVDVYGEFFIQHIEYKNTSCQSDKYPSGPNTTATMSDGTSVNTDLWRYEISFDMLPQNFTPSWAQKVLFIGQTVVMFNLDPHETMINKCHLWNQEEVEIIEKGSLWNDKENVYFNKLQNLANHSTLNMLKYEQVIDEIKSYVSERLSEIAINQADLIKQLKLIKDFYLLGRGELYLEFIKQTRNISATTIDESVIRDVTKAFEGAANSVNVADDLDQFSMSIKTDCLNTSITGYDFKGFMQCIMLKYKVKWPLHLLFSPKVIERYNDMFRFLLQIKKIQYLLHTVWCDHREKKIKKYSNLLQMRNKLMFLVDNLQYYLQADVLEAQFCILMNTVQSSKDFEHIQRAHTLFQANILSLCFLLPNHEPSTTVNVTSMMHTTENPVLIILNRIMQTILDFCTLSLNCSDPMTASEEQTLENCELLFSGHVSNLMKLLIGLEAGPSNAPLAQLLLRLDYNYWFSSQQAQAH